MNVVWTKTSELTLEEIIEYIKINFGLRIAEEYFKNVIETLKAIALNPEIFPIYQLKTDTRKAVINKKTILYYKIDGLDIYLIAFYDTRKGIHKL